MYQGSYVAIVTPFNDDNALDEAGLRRNIHFLSEHGSSGLVVCATTGESPTLSDTEYERVIKIAVEENKGRLPIIAGAGANSTAKTIGLIEKAEKFGAQGALVVTPYYNRPTQDGLYRHYRSASEASGIPIIIYNVPSRTGCSILPDTVAKLADDCGNIVALKAASGNLDQVSEIVRLTSGDFDVLSGDDSLTLPMLAIGGKGVISVIANILPAEVAAMCQAFSQGEIKQARKLHLKLFPVIKALFLETNPIPVKMAMGLMGMPAGKPRLPLVEMNEKNVQILKKRLIEFGIEL